MIIGAITGLVGFGLFLSIILLADRVENGQADGQANEQGELQPVQSSEESIVLYALQHGVFSSRDAAAQFINEHPILNLSTIIQHNQSYYIWSVLAPEKYDVTQEVSSFWKEVPMQNKCPKYPKLLEHFKNLSENNLLDIAEFSTKIPSEWADTLQKISNLSSDTGVWRVQILGTDIETSGCIQFNL